MTPAAQKIYAEFDGNTEVMAEALVKIRQQLNCPLTKDFVKAVELEAAHQRERWGSKSDAGKTDADWFWLIGYLGGKALHTDNLDFPDEKAFEEKKLHRIITIAAAACNWYLAMLGKTDMRPGTAQT